jgi:SUF system FeS cluster assembly, SufBD
MNGSKVPRSQFERTLIICDEGSFVHYIEGCTAPIYTTDSLHSAVVEIIVKRGARCRYTTIQNWSTNVYNLVTKRAAAYAGATMEWVDGNLGCLAAGTRVFTNNDVKPIEEVGVSDFVYSLTNGFEWVTRRVLATKVNPPRPTWRMTTADDARWSQLTTTRFSYGRTPAPSTMRDGCHWPESGSVTQSQFRACCPPGVSRMSRSLRERSGDEACTCRRQLATTAEARTWLSISPRS